MTDDDLPIRRLTTGSHQLDDILDGGIPENSLNIIMRGRCSI
jgi:KaiC/GvpD/RAD55 family RecA-like ATPase